MTTHSELYRDYMVWRKFGFCAVTAYGMAKYGMAFVFDYLLSE